MAKEKKKNKKRKKRVDKDIRPWPSPFWRNYDYGGPEEGETEVSPGTGLYFGRMDKYKSVKDFIEKSRKRMRKKRKKALAGIIDSFGIIRLASKSLTCISDYILKLASEYEEKWFDIIEQKAQNNPRPFNDWFGGQDRVYIPFEMGPPTTVSGGEEQDVVNVLKEKFPEKCQEIDFVSGTCMSGKNKYRIGKLLNSAKNRELKELYRELEQLNQENGDELDPKYLEVKIKAEKQEQYWTDVINSFVNSPARTRSTGQDAKYFVVISQNPHDIAQMSTGRSWVSCMTLGTGTHHQDVFCDVAEGGLIAYLIKANDRDIKNPISRIRIRRFTNIAGKSFAQQEDTMYGDDVAKFAEVVKGWINSKQKAPMGVYKLEGGQWSDTFSGNMVVTPDVEDINSDEELLAWLKTPQEVEGAIYDYWVVTDVMRDDEELIGYGEDEYGGEAFLPGYYGDWPTEKYFDDEAEAIRYADIMNNSSWMMDMMWDLESQAQREYESEAQYEGLSQEQIEENIESGEYRKHSQHKEYLDDDFKRFKVEKDRDDNTKMIRRAIAGKIIDAPSGTYSPEVVLTLRDILFDESLLHDPDLKKRFVSRFSSRFPEIAEDIINLEGDVTPLPIKSDIDLTVELYKSLPDGDKKERVKQTLLSELQKGISLENIDKIRKDGWHAVGNVTDRIDVLEAFDQVPDELAKQIIDFRDAVSSDEKIPDKIKNNITKHIVHKFAMSKADTPAVQKFYEGLLPSFRVLPKGAKAEEEDQVQEIQSLLFDRRPLSRGDIDKTLTIHDLGWPIARLGAQGRQFIPYFKKQLDVVRNWKPVLGDKFSFPEDYPEAIKVRRRKALYDFKRKQMERIMYIIDALENGTGFSRKYSFHSEPS